MQKVLKIVKFTAEYLFIVCSNALPSSNGISLVWLLKVRTQFFRLFINAIRKEH